MPYPESYKTSARNDSNLITFLNYTIQKVQEPSVFYKPSYFFFEFLYFVFFDFLAFQNGYECDHLWIYVPVFGV